MAASGYTPISLYYSSTTTNTPSSGNLVNGELAINIADGKLFYKDSSGNVQIIATKGGVGSSSTTQVLYNSSGLVVGSSNLTFNGTTLTAGGFSGPHNGTVGATTPDTGVFTTAKAIAASTQDAVLLQGRAGGTGSYAVTITPTTLTASRTLTMPDASGTILQSGTAVTIGQGGTGQTTANAGFNALSPMTTVGDIIYGGVSGAATRLGIGTTGYVLTVSGGNPVWAAATAGSPGGSTTQIQYNNAGSFAGSANLTFNGTTLTAAGLAGPHDGTVGATTPATGSFTTLAASSTVSGTGFSTYLASPPAIGGTAAAAGTFTTGTFSSTVHKGSTSGNVTITAPAVAGTQSYTLPSALPAADNQALICTTGGVMSWANVLLGAPSTVEYLVVAGGGGGGPSYVGGGVGAGGYRTATDYVVTSGSAITVTVGAGGAAQPTSASAGNDGVASVFGSITSTGGGGGSCSGPGAAGSSYAYNAGRAGGSGSGSTKSAAVGAGTSGQGNNGGTGLDGFSVYTGGGGGGGAGAVGGNSSNPPPSGGAGGVGLNWNSLGTFYAGGGGGGVDVSAVTIAAGGNGGGGSGGNTATAATAGTANTGGGGGGSGTSNGTGKAGGSGIVIIRYSNNYTAAASTTGSPTVTNTGGYRYYTFTGSGSITF